MLHHRRQLLLATLAPLVGAAFLRSATATTVEAGGLLAQSWFLESFLDLREDLDAVAAAGKRLAILIEQKGCPFCRQLHEVNFADAAVTDYVRARFDIIQLDLHGARELTDLDGSTLEERVFARRAAGTATPVILFLPESVAAAAGRSAAVATVARMPGYLPPPEFLVLFRYVAERAYRHERFDAFLRRQS